MGKIFLNEQGHKLLRTNFNQDNTSAIKMIANGQNSCNGKSRHIHIRYFFTEDVIEREHMTIQHCPTNLMIADYYTKPLQAKQFYVRRSVLKLKKK